MNVKSIRTGLWVIFGVAICAFFVAPPTASTAYAQEDGADEENNPRAFQLQRFRPTPGPGDYMGLWSTAVSPHLDWSAGFYFNYADTPLQLGTPQAPRQDTMVYQSQFDLTGSLGLFDVVEVGVVVPWTMRQRSRDLGILAPEDGSPISQTALNDLRLSTKYQIPGLDDLPIALAVVGGMSIPTGDSESLTGDGGLGGELVAVGEYVFKHTIRLGANLGFRYRSGERQMRANVLGNEIIWGLAGHSPLFAEDFDILAEVEGAIAVQPSPSHLSGVRRGEVPAEARMGVRWGFHPDWSATVGAGTGMSDGVGTPNWRIFIGINGKWATGGWWNVDFRSPNFAGEMDPCDPLIREQQQGRLRFDPADCPDPPEDDELTEEDIWAGLDDPDGDTDWEPPPPPPPPEELDHGEDDEGFASLRQGAIVIMEQITFETGSAQIHSDSFEVLDDVATLLHRNQDIRLMRIEGHTDSVGNAEMNLRLSEDRAASVRQYLVDRGIDGSRLTTVGYGEYEPIADNATAEGRARNRRVDFNIMEMAPP